MKDENKLLRRAIVTGAAGFAGYSLTSHLLEDGYEVLAVVRPRSMHNERLRDLDINIVELDGADYKKLPEYCSGSYDLLFHLAWGGGRDDFYQQLSNINDAVSAVEAAAELGCKRFIATGSQAEYGVCSSIITESVLPDPKNAYGASKLAAMYLTKRRARQLGVEWIWGRIFSLYGKYEPSGRMLPDLVSRLIEGEHVQLSSCTQYWDYLNVDDAADALIALAKEGRDGEVYNIAHGDYRPLKHFVKEILETGGFDGDIDYGDPPSPYIELRPDISKITSHTGWSPKIDFKAGIKKVIEEKRNEKSG